MPTPPPRRHGPQPQTSRRDRWILLADDLFKISHDDRGKPLLHRDNANLGLAAAVLGELLLEGHVDVSQDKLLWPTSPKPPIDGFADLVMKQVRGETQRPVRDWLKYLASPQFPDGEVYTHIGRRLQTAGQCEAQQGIFRRSVRYQPRDGSDWAMPWVRISRRINERELMSAYELLLGGLVMATDLHREVFTGDPRDVETEILAQLAETHDAIRELVHQTRVATGSTVAAIA